MSLRLKLLTSLLIGGLLVCGAVVWGAHEAALQQLRQDLVERARLLSTSINEATQAASDDDAIRVAVEDITRQAHGVTGITVATRAPFTLWASSFKSKNAQNPDVDRMLRILTNASHEGVFGHYFSEEGDLILVEPLWPRSGSAESDNAGNHMHALRSYPLRDTGLLGQSLPFEPDSALQVPGDRYRGAIYVQFDWKDAQAIAGNILWDASIIALVGLGAMLALSFLLLQQFVIKPLRTIQTGIQHQAAGEQDYRVGQLGNDEFGELGNNFNEMLDSVTKGDARIRAIVDHIPIAMTLRDHQGDTVLSNKRSQEWMHNEPFAFTDQGPHSDWVERVQRGEQFAWDHSESTEAGDIRHFHTVAFPVISKTDELVEFGTASTDITARKELESALIRAKEDAESANKAKSRFLSSMSHELRTPLNALIGFTELMRLGTTEEEQEQYLDQMDRAGRHLLALIGEVLDLAQVESGKLKLQMESVSVADVVSECLELAAPIAREREIPLINECPADGGFVAADFTRLKQALLNLVSNAIKYNRPGGSVTIRSHRVNETELCLTVEDTGPGIPKDKQALLFQPFERLGAANSNIEGTGIGLVFSRRIVELMNGRLGFESEPGKGSRFWIELPRLCEDGGLESSPGSTSAHSHDDAYFHPSSGKTVLCIEDNPANLQLIESMLNKVTDCRVIKAMDPITGLRLADEHQPDLVLLDINLPQMNGYDVLKSLRENAGFGTSPVIAISSDAMPEDIQRGLDAGFDQYLPKPLVMSDFVAALRAHLVL